MTERFASDLVFILVALIVAAILGYIIGYLCKKAKHAKCVMKLENDIEQLKSKNEQLKSDLDECMRQKEKPQMLFDAVAAADVFKRKIVEDDLKIVEGIGEKIEALLRHRGIDTWYKLSQSSETEIKNILLTDGGPAYQIHDPKTWPSQALLAFEGKWSQLKEYQDQLIGGR
jgi:predicted flap endonuclease-1-like 5' DNA nuclease